MTEGQQAAIVQLEEIGRASRGAIAIGKWSEPEEGKALWIPLALDCSEIEVKDGGLPLRKTEVFRIEVPPGFPYKKPSAYVKHLRFDGQAHIQVGMFLCIYRSPSVEWDPSLGMYGFLARLAIFLDIRASGKEDPDGAPIHPPVAYLESGYDTIVSSADCPAVVSSPWIGTARLNDPESGPRTLIEYGDCLDPQADSQLAPTFLLPTRLPFEFPETLEALVFHLKAAGVSEADFKKVVGQAALSNSKESPLYIVIGTPMRQGPGGNVISHLAVWKISQEEADLIRDLKLHENFAASLGEITLEYEDAIDRFRTSLWKLVGAKVHWCRIYETRPQATERRDTNTLARVVADKKIAVLGCGALGAPIAHAISRMAPRYIRVFDNKCVSPGILSRQPYRWNDIGKSKARCLARDIKETDDRLDIDGHHVDVLNLLDRKDWCTYDLIIDATANLSVLQKLEATRRLSGGTFPTILSIAVGPACRRGIVRVAGQESREGPWAVDRRAKIYASQKDKVYYDEFWPDQGGGVF